MKNWMFYRYFLGTIFPQRKHIVYALCEPAGNRIIKYIGCCQNIKSRYYEHLSQGNSYGRFGSKKEKWIKSLLDRKLYPRIKVIAEFDSEQLAFDYENYLIAKLGKDHSLVNSRIVSHLKKSKV